MNPDQNLEQNPLPPPVTAPFQPPAGATQTPAPAPLPAAPPQVAPTQLAPLQGNVGTPMKHLRGWKAALIWILLIGLAGLFIVSGAFLFLPILVPFIAWYILVLKKQRSAIKAYAESHGFIFQTNTVLNDLDGVIFQSPEHIIGSGAGPSSGYYFTWLVHGQINGRNFRMYEFALPDSNNNDSRRTGDFDVLDIALKGEGLQFLLVSNTHQTMMNRIHINLKRYQLEGNFNNYFSLYGPDGGEIEILRIFTPDTMAYLIDHYQNYSLELTPQHFFIYRGNSSLAQEEANCESLVNAANDLAAKFFANVEKVKYAENAVVPPTAQVPYDQSRIAGGFPLWTAVIGTLVICAAGFGIIKLVSNDSKIPSGYVLAQNAKVSQDTELPCNTTNCATSYSVTATFTANGKPYWYRDTLPDSHPVNSAITLYYNPSNPTQADFVGGHSSRGAIPVVATFLGICLLFLWIAYFIKRPKAPALS